MHAARPSFGHADQPPVGQTTWEYYNIYNNRILDCYSYSDVFHSFMRAARVYHKIRAPVSFKATFTPNPGLWIFAESQNAVELHIRHWV